jgi:hypothetical protein
LRVSFRFYGIPFSSRTIRDTNIRYGKEQRLMVQYTTDFLPNQQPK